MEKAGDERMVSENLQSPNAIPPRTSSTGITNLNPSAPKPVLKPVPEATWIAQGKKAHGHSQSMSSNAGGVGGDPSAHITDEMINQANPTWSREKENILFGPYDYMINHPGKEIRTQLIGAFNKWLKVPPESLTVITKVIGMLHTSSLLIDDVEDSSELRRGIPVAHSIFGTPQTINSSNYIYFCALQELQKLNNPKALVIYTEELLNLHRGQGMDLFWRDTLTCPSEEDYLEMVGNKTGGLFRLAVKLMQAESQSDNTTYTHNKGLCEDLTEGKFSFPIIHSIRANPSNLELLNILKQRSRDEDVKRYAVSYMERTGSFAYTRALLGGLMERARTLITTVDEGRGENGGILHILEKMGVE
ncbi:MAG: hypothetical protein M4579_006644 [Chaenotheca gracillima]|nr:MAG: hypothetical protein M4579_006644 [Chaenotheca gracillima]